ncbi:putative lipopolysaccharide core biosynthesis mannosyltransferase [Reinekea sp. MED297]|uniref:Putative lipopolysaccharide core biosynthesis mannosyltransferase n=2 Tax=Reinekea TaxID=230494 RepID=A4BC98_9GAMM|nr:putative lipopolysaccharide core biosynthesis mannosyltransferase [Reinekea sp. MED297] [Reinekea blandensis MED297]
MVHDYSGIEVVLGNSNKRFSGVTSTMLQVLSVQRRYAQVSVLGRHHLLGDVPAMSFWQAVRRLRQTPQDQKQRIFHARRNDEMIQALLLKYLFGAQMKIVFTSTAQRRKSWLTRWLMSRMDGLISTCQAAADYMPDPPDVIIPHGIDVQALNNTIETGQQPALSKPATNLIGIFGRVRAQKGIDLLVEAAVKLLPDYPDWGVVIVGQVTEEQKAFQVALERQIEQAGLKDRIVFTGELPYKQVVTWFQQVSIVTALSTNEGFGLTVLEALAAGKPVVATRAGAWPDILGQQDVGKLIEVGDQSALISALNSLMSDGALREQYGAAGKQLVSERYTVEREALELLDFYVRKVAE